MHGGRDGVGVLGAGASCEPSPPSCFTSCLTGVSGCGRLGYLHNVHPPLARQQGHKFPYCFNNAQL